MAESQIDNALIIQFSDSVHIQAQQQRARMRPFVEVKPMTGETFAYDGLGSVEASQIQGRSQPVVFSDINHLRRQIARQRFALTLPIDSADVRGMLENPQNEYAKACVRAMERVFDRIVMGAVFATVYTGRQMATPITAAADGVVTLDATAGLTYQSLITIGKNFIDADVGNDIPEKIVLCIAGSEHAALMQETELVDSLYSQHYAIDKGRMASAAGLDIVLFAGGSAIAQPVLQVVAGVRQCVAMSTRAVCVGMSKEFSLKIQERADLYETTQVQIVFDLGAVRTEGVLAQQVNTTPA